MDQTSFRQKERVNPRSLKAKTGDVASKRLAYRNTSLHRHSHIGHHLKSGLTTRTYWNAIIFNQP